MKQKKPLTPKDQWKARRAEAIEHLRTLHRSQERIGRLILHGIEPRPTQPTTWSILSQR